MMYTLANAIAWTFMLLPLAGVILWIGCALVQPIGRVPHGEN